MTDIRDAIPGAEAGSRRWLNRTVAGAGVTSALGDFAYETSTVILPGFLAVLGIPAVVLGFIEGAADAVASFTKMVAGYIADKLGHRKSLVLLGYALTPVGQVLIALAVGWPFLLLGRLVSWFGKGLRGPLRDAVAQPACRRSCYHMDPRGVRGLIPDAAEYVYFETSGHSLKPAPIIDEVVSWLRFQSRGPAVPEIYQKLAEMLEQTRARVALAINANPAEIMLNENTTVGINVVAHGIDWRPGDAVVLTTHEHPGNRLPWYNLARRYGIELRFVPVSPDEDLFLTDLDRAIDGRTRLVSVSHVSRRTGLRFPARAIADLVHQRGVPVLLDGAQAFGAIPVDVRALDCDFYTLGGHKYIMAPQGTGALYVRRDRIDWLRPSWIGSRSQQQMDNDGNFVLQDGAKRFEYGTRDWANLAGFGRALELWESIGWDRVFEQIARYTDQVKAALQTLPGAELETPLPYEQSSGIVAVRFPGQDARAISASLREHERVICSAIDAESLRISTHVYNNNADLATLLNGLRRVLSGQGNS